MGRKPCPISPIPNCILKFKTLIKLRDKGRLTQAEFEAEVRALGLDPLTVFDQRGALIERQINVTCDYVDQRQLLSAGASPEARHRAMSIYIN
jgi:hypothetical protein